MRLEKKGLSVPLQVNIMVSAMHPEDVCSMATLTGQHYEKNHINENKTNIRVKNMQYRPVVLIILAGLLFPAASNTVFAHEAMNWNNELSEIDSFHPPSSGDPRTLMYKEWHYFNILDVEQNLSFITTLTLMGNISDPTMSVAVVLMNYLAQAKENLTIDSYPITLAQWSDKTPDLRIAESTVMLTEKGYYVHLESSDAQTVFDAIFKPEAEQSTVLNASYEVYKTINWLVTSPKMKVNGALTINKGTTSEKTYLLKNVRGYHDHNWGYWLWEDNIGWDWGQAAEMENFKRTEDTGTYAFSFGNITNKNHTESKKAVLEIWKNKKITAHFEDGEIQIQRDIMMNVPQLPETHFPLVTSINTDSGENTVHIVFTTEQFTPIPTPLESGNGYRIIWELIGSYEVSGIIDGKQISYTTKGYLEYVA